MQPTQQMGQSGDQGFYAPAGQPQYVGTPPSPVPQVQPPAQPARAIEWEASEYVHHDKGVGWMALLVLITMLLVGGALWFRQWLFAVLIVVMAVAFGVLAVRRPKVLHYHLTDQGITVAGKNYPLSDFRAFGVVPDGAVYSITLLPTKRFSPAVSIYFASPDGESIVDILGAHLPMEQIKPDIVDIIMRKLRF